MNQLAVVNEESAHHVLVFENNGEVVTDSLLIAEVFGKTHDNVLKDIRKQMEYAGYEFSLVNFHERNYENRGRLYPKINLTEEAFTLVVMSYNTKEAVQMKLKFIQEFKRMKEHIRKYQQLPTDPMSILKLTFDALEGQKKELTHVKAEVKDLKENTPLYATECDEVVKTVNKTIVQLLGGKQSNAYQNKSVRDKVYKDIYRELRRHFNVKSYKAIKRRYLYTAKNMIMKYELPIVLSEEITQVNNQLAVEF
ncbi:ORF6C domain-containing protein [Bacillus cereus]|uniref:Rha family transcriptional regulator n=1 Tax=Bacillus cereus TaxID=1396 RepID=UPI0018F475E3|nr:ORF6C domain-containing protein [Bacillus cereus]MBJ8055266.1 ORF6C domain-containing protein [Bacillus cereus]